MTGWPSTRPAVWRTWATGPTGLGRVRRKTNGLPAHAGFFAGLPLRAHVDGARGIVADEHDGEAGRYAERLESLDLLRDVLPYETSDRGAIDERRAVAGLSRRRRRRTVALCRIHLRLSAQSPPPVFRE